MNLKIKSIYYEIEKEYGISFKQVKDIVENQFKFVKKTMAEGIKNNPKSFKNIQITHLGKFAVRKYKLEEYARKEEGRRREAKETF
tara:strand:+ start:306 stop:563 length:258 start_codon:yes stop_codon:yes gene_type:complete